MVIAFEITVFSTTIDLSSSTSASVSRSIARSLVAKNDASSRKERAKAFGLVIFPLFLLSRLSRREDNFSFVEHISNIIPPRSSRIFSISMRSESKRDRNNDRNKNESFFIPKADARFDDSRVSMKNVLS